MINKSNIKLILFDIGNVLVNYDTSQLCFNLDAYSQLPDHDCLKIEEYLCEFGVFNRLEKGEIGIDQLYVDLMTRFNMHWDIYDFIIAWTKELRVNEDMMRLVSTLSERFDIGILSNIDSLRYRYMINNSMIDTSKIAHFFLSYKMRMVKPDIRIANYVSYHSQIANSKILFVDDKDINVRSMQAGGIKSIQYENLSKLLDDFKKMGIGL